MSPFLNIGGGGMSPLFHKDRPPCFNSQTTGPIFTIFLYDVQELVELLMHVSARRWCIPFWNARTEQIGSILTSAKTPKINWLAQQRPLDYSETYVSFIIPIYMSTKAETLEKIHRVIAEIFGEIGRFLLFNPKRCISYPRNL